VDEWRRVRRRGISDVHILPLGISTKKVALYYPVCEKHKDFRTEGVAIHGIYKEFFEISLPDGKYAQEFSLLNNCNKFDGHRLMQNIVEAIHGSDSDSVTYFEEERVLCPDGGCIGIIEDGICTECGKKVW